MLAGCAALAVASCGTTHTTEQRTGSATLPAAGVTARQRAVADAAAILKAFVPPPGARRLAKAPAVVGGLLEYASSTIVSTALVADVAFWQAPGEPQAVLAWEQAHLPRRFTPQDMGFGPPSWFRAFSLAPVPGVLNNRDLVVEVVGMGGGQTAIRVDAQVAWQPPRPPGELVPPAARVVTITRLPGLLPGAKRPPAPVTITDAAVVRRIAALVDGLPLSTIGPASCPMVPGGGIQLTFRARPGGPPLAVAQGPAPCGTVLFSIGAEQQPALQLTDTFITQVLGLAGLHWTVG